VRVWSGGGSQLVRQRTVTLPVAKDGPNPAFAISGDLPRQPDYSGGVHVESWFTTAESNAAICVQAKVAISALAFTGRASLWLFTAMASWRSGTKTGERVTASKRIQIADPLSCLHRAVCSRLFQRLPVTPSYSIPDPATSSPAGIHEVSAERFIGDPFAAGRFRRWHARDAGIRRPFDGRAGSCSLACVFGPQPRARWRRFCGHLYSRHGSRADAG